MRYLILLFLVVNSYAGLLDFYYLNQANQAYNKQDYKTAGKNFAKLNSDSAKYDLANSLYKEKNTKKLWILIKLFLINNCNFKNYIIWGIVMFI